MKETKETKEMKEIKEMKEAKKIKAVVFTGGEIKNYNFCEEYLLDNPMIIACDSGMEHTRNLDIVPDYIVGDFDSVSKDTFEYYENLNVPSYKFPAEKDETDTQLGLDVAVREGATDIVVVGGIGSRFDHTLANAHLLLRLLKCGIRARMVNEHNCIEIFDKSGVVHGKKGDLVSTIPLSSVVRGLTLDGFAYGLKNRDLHIDDELVAVSNILLGKVGNITFEDGQLYVIKINE